MIKIKDRFSKPWLLRPTDLSATHSNIVRNFYRYNTRYKYSLMDALAKMTDLSFDAPGNSIYDREYVFLPFRHLPANRFVLLEYERLAVSAKSCFYFRFQFTFFHGFARARALACSQSPLSLIPLIPLPRTYLFMLVLAHPTHTLTSTYLYTAPLLAHRPHTLTSYVLPHTCSYEPP